MNHAKKKTCAKKSGWNSFKIKTCDKIKTAISQKCIWNLPSAVALGRRKC